MAYATPDEGRKQWLRAPQCLDLRFFVHAGHSRIIVRIEIQPDDIAHFVNQQRVGRLKVSLRCGCSPNACQIRLMAVRLSLIAFAISRVLQCIAPRGVASNAA
jgi:hypothetical protein